MEPNVKNIKKLVDAYFDGNNAAFAEEIGVSRAQVSRLFNQGDGVGAQFFGGLISYCERTGLNWRDYIFLPLRVHKIDASKRRRLKDGQKVHNAQ